MALTQVTTGGVDENINIDSNTLKVDGTNNLVGIGTASPGDFDSEANNLVVGDGSGDNGITIFTGSSAGDFGSIYFADSSSGGAAKKGQIRYEQNNEVMSFFTNEAERLRIDLNGKVGIGQTSPNALLEVNSGTAGNEVQRIEGAYSGSGSVVLTNWRRAGGAVTANIEYHDSSPIKINLGTKSDHNFALKTGNADRLTIDTSGRVGLGTSSPGSYNLAADNLVIVDSGNAGITIRSGTSSDGAIYFNDTDDVNQRGIIRYVHASDALAFHTSAGESLRIDSSGRLLAGTSTSPSAGSGQYAKLLSSGNTLSATGDGRLVLARGKTSANLSSGNAIGELLFTDSTGATFASIGANTDGTTGGVNGNPGRLAFYTESVGSDDGPEERMRIDSSGVIKHTGSTGAGGANKLARYVVPSHNTNEEDVVVFQVENESSSNQITFGGGTSSYNAATQIVFRTASAVDTTVGSERMRIDSSGFITQKFTSNNSSTPEGLLINNDNNATGNNASLIFSNDSGNRKKIAIAAVDVGNYGASDLVFALDGADSGSVSLSSDEKMRIDSSGRVGIKNSSPSSQYFNDLVIGDGTSDHGITLHAGSSNSSAIAFSDATSGAGRYAGYLQYDHGSDSMRFYTNGGNERVRITNNGYFLVGTSHTSPGDANTNTGFSIEPNGKIYISCAADGGHINRNNTGYVLHTRNNGNHVGGIYVTSSATSLQTSSDYRLKENVVDLSGAITRVKQLAPKRFNFIIEPGTTVDGFLAHEAQTVVPEAVTGTHNEVDDDGNAVMQGIDQSKLVPLLTAALQEAIAKIETLETKVAALEAAA